MHVLVTGGAGFIGSHVVEYHLRRGDKVHVVDDLSTGREENLAPFSKELDFRFDQSDILVWPGLERASAWADRIYHMAAVVGVFRVLEDPIRVLAVNIAGCERVLRAAHTGNWTPQIVIASTSEVYGTGVHCARHKDGSCPGLAADKVCKIGGAFHEDLEPMVGSSAVSRWNYSISKLADEAFGISYARQHKLKVTVVRFFNTVGPRQRGRYGMVVPRFVKQAVAGEPITVFGDGSQSRSFCDVRDTVASLDLLAANPASHGQIVNVGNSREITILQLAELVKKTAASDSPIKHVPYNEAYVEVFQETVRRKPDLGKFNELTGYKHAWTLEATLKELVETERAGGGK